MKIVAEEATSQTMMGALNRARPLLVVSAPRDSKPIKLVRKDRMNEADRAANGKFANDTHTSQAREHVLAASIAANSNDMEEVGRRIESALIHSSHSQNTKASSAIESLQQAKLAHGAGNVHDVQRNLDTAYSHLQGQPNKLLQMKKVRESSPDKPLIETLTFHPRFIESSFDPVKRTVDVIIIEEGMGNKRDRHFYLPKTLQETVKNHVFNGAQAYADHPSKFDDANRPERSVRDLIGYYFDDRIVATEAGVAIAAKLKIQEGVDWALGLVKEAIEYNKKFPDKVYVGISINADGDTSPNERDGQQVNDVTSITEAFSADMVTKPARGGKFLQLVESVQGAHKGATVTSKIIDAATQLEKLAEGQEVDPKTLLELAKTIREAQGDVNDLSKKGSSNNKVGTGQMSEAMKGKAKAANFDMMNEADQSKWMTDNADDNDGDEVAATAKKKEAAATLLGSLTESQIKELFPTIYSAALTETSAQGSDELSKLRRRNAELEAADKLRESHALAVSKLRESKIPEGAFAHSLSTMLGKSSGEMDQYIKAQESFMESMGDNKRSAGGTSGAIRFTESSKDSNMSDLLAGVVED